MEKATARGMVERIASLLDVSADEILLPDDAGAMFGVTGWAMYKRAKKGQAPGPYVGRRLYFVKSELIGFIQNL